MFLLRSTGLMLTEDMKQWTFSPRCLTDRKNKSRQLMQGYSWNTSVVSQRCYLPKTWRKNTMCEPIFRPKLNIGNMNVLNHKLFKNIYRTFFFKWIKFQNCNWRNHWISPNRGYASFLHTGSECIMCWSPGISTLNLHPLLPMLSLLTSRFQISGNPSGNSFFICPLFCGNHCAKWSCC